MKVYKVVTYSGLGIILLITIFFATLSVRFPDSTISWQGIIIFSIPAIALEMLLFIKPRLLIRSFRILLFATGFLAILAAGAGWMSYVILGIFIIALGAMYLPLSIHAPREIKTNEDRCHTMR